MPRYGSTVADAYAETCNPNALMDSLAQGIAPTAACQRRRWGISVPPATLVYFQRKA